MVDHATEDAATPVSGPLAVLLDPLAGALAGTGFAGVELRPLADAGLAHHHVRLGTHRVLARIPKQSQLGLDARRNLAYQAACFERASRSGHAPQLVGVVDPTDDLPRGALLVEYIEGRPAALPDDLPAIMTALAGIHALPMPDVNDRRPIADPSDALAALDDEIRAQAGHLDAAGIDAVARTIIDAELARLRVLRAGSGRPSRHLISLDAHPGNFVIRPAEMRCWSTSRNVVTATRLSISPTPPSTPRPRGSAAIPWL